MKKQATAEQKARAAERREKFGALCKQVAEMSESARAELVAKVGAVLSCEGRALSDINTALLVLQYQGAVSIVGGFRQWRKQGRYVMKGQRGASIWIPKSKGEAPADADKRPGEISGRELAASDKRRFFLGTVFDISQTAEFCAGDGDEGAEDSEETGAEVVPLPPADREPCEYEKKMGGFASLAVPSIPPPRLGYSETVLELEGGLIA